ncbi:MAG: carboxypeptidase regulatory-like domain-containing protein [Patescibacteria group bacterium]|jgi:hypothetical protein
MTKNICLVSFGVLLLVLGVAFGFTQPASASVAVSGTIVSPSGAALSQAGGYVSINPTVPGPGNGASIDPTGAFSVGSISAGQYEVQIAYQGNDGDYAGPTPFKINVGDSAVNLGAVHLTNPSIVGYVTAPDGTTRVGNSWVQIRTADWTFNTGTGTDDNGNFKFGGIPNGSFTIDAQPPQGSAYTSSQTPLTFSGTPVTGQIIRLDTPNVIGTVKDPDGNALDLSQGNVNCDIFNQDRTVQKNSNANPVDGSFRFGTLPTGAYTIECRPNNLVFTAAVPKSVSVTSGTLLNVGVIKLTTAQVVGTVFGPDGSTPTANANVQVHTDDWTTNSSAQSAQNGQYQIGGLPAGTYKLEVQAPWGSSGLISPEQQTITISSGVITKNLTFVSATKFLVGQVKKNNGTPVGGAMVNANKDGGFGFSNTTTDSNGNYTLALSGGLWNIMVSPNMGPGSQAVDWFFSGPPQRVEFSGNSSTENKTLNLTVQTANASVTGRVVKPDGSAMTNANVDVRNQEGIGNNGQVRPDGTFTVNVQAGSYRVSVFSPDNQYTFSEINITIGDNEAKDIGTLTAKSKSAKIVGKVVKSDGTGVGGVYVNSFMHGQPGWSNTQSDSEGNFTLAVTSGRWGVNIDQGRNQRYVYSGPPVDVDVPTETSTVSVPTMVLTFADATISGSVVDMSGNVVSGFCAYVEARPATSGIGGFGPGYGGPVNCQNGSFSISVPSSVASTYTLSIHTPPNAPYSAVDNQNVAVFANATSTKNIQVKANDATVEGRLIDQNGHTITSCVSSKGWFGDVHFDRSGSWKGGEIRSDCTYSVSLLSGEGYHMGYFIESSNGFMMKPPDPTPITIAVGVTTMNLTVNKADATITGRVVDPNGNGVDAFVFAGNWVEFEGQGNNPENFKNELHSDVKTNPDGTFSLGVLKGHRYEVGMGLPPGSAFIPADFEKVDMRTASTANITLRLDKALGTMSGTVKIAGTPLNMGFVHCWEENGGFTGGPVMFGGAYSVNYRAGTWHCGADSFDGTSFYQSDEEIITITTQTSITKDFPVTASNFTVPAPVTTTFDAGTAQVINLENGTSITIPSGALGDSGTNVTVSANPTVTNLFRMKNVQPFGVGYDLTALDADNNEITTFNSNVTIKFPYSESQLTALGIDEGTLVSKFFDETTSSYQNPIGVVQDNDNNTITIQTNHFTTFVLVSGASAGSNRGPADILAVPAASGGPQVILADENGKVLANFFAYSSTLRIGIEAVTGDVDGDGVEEIIVAPGSGAGPQVRVFNKSGKLLSQFFAYPESIKTGIHVTSADINGDGTDEIITSPMAGAGPQVRVFNRSGNVIHQFFAYNSSFRGGSRALTGDVDGDGVSEIVTVPDSNAGPEVGVFEASGTVIKRFNAYAAGVRGGFNAALGDMDGDGDDDIVVSTKAGNGPQVAVFDKNGATLSRFFAYASTFRGGVNVSVGDVDGDGSNDVVVSPISTAGPQVRVFSSAGKVKSQFFAYASRLRGNFTSFVADLDGNGTAEVVTAPGAGMGPQVRTFSRNGGALSQFFSHHKGFRGGLTIFPAY